MPVNWNLAIYRKDWPDLFDLLTDPQAIQCVAQFLAGTSIQQKKSTWFSIRVISHHRLKYFAKKELGQYPAILTEQAWPITHIQYVAPNPDIPVY